MVTVVRLIRLTRGSRRGLPVGGRGVRVRRRGRSRPFLLSGVALAGALLGSAPAEAAGPAPICPTQWKETSSFEPTQGVWQDDWGTYSFGDRAGARLTRTETPLAPGEFPHTLATAELPMVQDRPTLIFGTQRFGGDRFKITLTATTSGTSDIAAFVRFKLSENDGPSRVVYESPVASIAIGWGPDPSNPCGADKHDVTFTVLTPDGIPDNADPFQFTATGTYRLTAVLVIPEPDGEKVEFQQIKTAVEGTIVATYPPHFEIVPATLTDRRPLPASQVFLKLVSDELASEIASKFATYLPIPVKGPVRADKGEYRNLQEALTPFMRARVDNWARLFKVPPQGLVGTVKFQKLVDDLGIQTRLEAVYDRTIVVMGERDFAAAGLPSYAQAISASRKVIFVRSDSTQYNVGHEFSHTLCSGDSPACVAGFAWSDPQMLAECNQNVIVSTADHPSMAYHNDVLAHKWAHGYRLFDEVSGAGEPHYSRALMERSSIMQETSPSAWIDQCIYAHDLKELQKLPDPPVILVSGLVAQPGGRAVGTLLPAYELHSQVNLTAHVGGRWAIVLRGSHNRVLGRFPFTPAFSYEDPSLKRIVAPVQYTVPAMPRVTAIDLYGPGGRLDHVIFSARAPRIRLQASVARSILGHQKIVRASWSGVTSRDRSLLYTLLDSPDGGATWNPVFFERSLRSADVSVPRGSRVILKLIATDGSRSTTVQRTIAVGA